MPAMRSASARSQTSQTKTLSTRAPPPPSNSSVEDHFFWTYTEEPHKSRRQAIIKAHPELCGYEPLTKYVVLGVVSLQVACAYLLRNTPVLSWPFFLTAYVIGATANQNLFLAIHEISHNLAFKLPLANRLLAIFANFPIGLPYSAAFRPYHLTHHKSLGVASLDTDLPTALEAVLFDSILGKAFFCTFQILFYAIRPMFIYTPAFTHIHFLNIIAQFMFDFALYKLCGSSMQSVYYLILSSFLAGSLHPCAGHFIAEHYFFSKTSGGTESIEEQRKAKSGKKEFTSASALASLPPPETYSYYGPLNIFTYNVGLHNEHHDFPAIPWTRLHTLHRIAKEFYEPLPCHRSWVWVIWTFILDKNVGMWCRVKRAEGGRMVGGKDNSGWKESEIQN
ncbi:dihydroceramide delta(4)-desaturase [Uncinocarpus reesii 1704]|uniref:Sphingolipid delta(4)-desaturase n=1 Tax=Uncinocarpus reesii (strain UAMH 1704) TaxID=336963 RepID=C4JSX7_UNCRE|nr:dihydroceramide delta(4)-desaturase [Uncinocarpus reesii 1704]EEP80724.1 dihydroceramide delta(4)-desaturase [Uncinocarpus reesii 1704]